LHLNEILLTQIISSCTKGTGIGVGSLRQKGLHNPLGIARLCSMLEAELLEAGCRIEVSSDFRLLDRVKQEARGDRVGPMHDADVCDFSGERAFWLRLVNSSNRTIGLQAFRSDEISTNLSDWLPNYMIGVYMRRNELMVPSSTPPTTSSIAKRLSGILVYKGELWLAREVKSKRIFDFFTRLGMLLGYMKWNPTAIWALTSEQMARHGHLGRIGFTTVERGFLRWQWASRDVDPIEYLAVIERDSLEQLVDEMLTTAMECQPARTHKLLSPEATPPQL
jgi:hypothetical protein